MEAAEVATIFGPYLTESILGSGQYGTVYTARHQSEGHVVALKVLSPQLVHDAKVRRRFVREGYASRRFDHHNVVHCLEASETDAERPWIAFELIRGVTLSRLLQEPVALARRIGWLSQLLSGIRHMHNRGAVHRDIKPGNIMVEVDEEGRDRVVVVDLGLAHFSDLESVSRAEEGTPSHLAPELVVTGAQPTIQSDLYSIGVVLFQMLEDRLPYEGSHGVAVALQQVTEPVPKLGNSLPVKERLRWQAVIDRALAKEITNRFNNADEFKAALPVLQSDALQEQELSGPSDFSLAIDAALVSARHNEETVDQLVIHPNVEQWLYPDAWRKCMEFLRAREQGSGLSRLMISSSRPGEAERFGYHLLRCLRSEGFFEIRYPYCELETDHLESRRLASEDTRLLVPEGFQPKQPTLIGLFRDEPTLGSYMEALSQSLDNDGVTCITVQTNGADSDCHVHLDVDERTDTYSWLTHHLSVESSLRDALLQRFGHELHTIRSVLSFLLVTGDAHQRGNQIVLSPIASPQDWPTDFEVLQTKHLLAVLRSDFGLRPAQKTLLCSAGLGGSWTREDLARLLDETQMDDKIIPHVLNGVSWFVQDVYENRSNALETLFANEVVRKAVAGLIVDPSRRRACLTRVLNLLMDVSSPGLDEMLSIVWCRSVLGESQKAAEDAQRFMRNLGFRQAYADAFKIGLKLDLLWDQKPPSNRELRARTWLLLSKYALAGGEALHSQEVASRVLKWAKQVGKNDLYADALFQVGLALWGSDQSSRTFTLLERSLEFMTQDGAEPRYDVRRVWQLRWVCYWAARDDQAKLSRSLEAFLSNRRSVSSQQESLRLLLVWLSRVPSVSESPEDIQAIKAWRSDVRLDVSVSAS